MRIIRNLMIAATMALLAASCSKVEEKMESQIPDDALMVMKADVPKLVGNLGITVKDGKLVLPQRVVALIEQSGTKMDDIQENFSKLVNSGIDLEHSLYCFVPKTSASLLSNPQVVFMLPVKDEGKLQKILADEMKITLEEKDGLLMADNSGMTIAINDDILYIVGGAKDGAEQIRSLAKLEKNMNDNADIKSALASSSDLNLYIDSKQQKDIAKSMAVMQGGQQAVMAATLLDMWDVRSTAYHLSLDGGEWKLTCNNNFDKNSQFVNLVNSITDKPSADLLNIMPKAANSAVLSMSINGEGIYNLEIVKSLLSDAQNNPEVSKLVDILKSIKGPVTIGIASNSLQPNDISMALAIKCGKAKDLMDMYKQTIPASAYKIEGDEIVQPNLVGPFEGRLGVKGDVLYIKAGPNYADNMAGVSEANNIIGKSMVGLFASMNVNNKQVEITLDNEDLSESNLKLWVKQDGKKLGGLETLAALFETFQSLK